MSDLIRKWLEEARHKRELIAYHRWDDDPEIFLVGFVKKVGAEAVVFEDVDTFGMREEDHEVPLAAIVGLDRDSKYLRGLAALNAELPKVEEEPGRSVKTSRTISKALQEALESGEVITLWNGDDERFTGFVTALEPNHFQFAIILDGGVPDGDYIFRLDRIKRARLGSTNEIRDKWLFDNHERIHRK